MTIVLALTRIEAAHLADLVGQFGDLLARSAADDPGLQRLSPAAYPDDHDASAEYRRLTESDAIQRRREGVSTVLAAIDAPTPEAVEQDPLAAHPVPVDAASADAWMRTLAALRLVLASRLGIDGDDDHDEDDPRFAVYDWLGYRLDELVRALG